jgi:hypothetical protein
MMLSGEPAKQNDIARWARARVKQWPKTESQTIQRREHSILEKHNSRRQSVGRRDQIGMAGPVAFKKPAKKFEDFAFRPYFTRWKLPLTWQG